MVLEIDINAVVRDVQKLDVKFTKMQGLALQFVQVAIVQFAEFLLGIAQSRAPITTGALRASGTVTDPIIDGDGSVRVSMGFNIVYAAIQDQGGVIRPVKAKALFIPLRDDPFIIPGSPGLKVGVDFVFAQEAILVGNTYFERTMDEHAPNAAEAIGRAAYNLLKEAFPTPPGTVL